MRKLFLTSGGLPNETRDAFLKLLGKNPQDTRVAFIPTAKDPEEDQSYVQRSLDQLDELGFVYESTDLKEYSKETLGEKLTQFDVIYVNGGNTFYLLDWIRKSGFYQIHDDQQIARLFLFDQKPMLITLFKNIQTCIQLLYF